MISVEKVSRTVARGEAQFEAMTTVQVPPYLRPVVEPGGRLALVLIAEPHDVSKLSPSERAVLDRQSIGEVIQETGADGWFIDDDEISRFLREQNDKFAVSKRKNPTFVGWGFCLSHEEPDDYLLSHGQSALSSAWSRFTVLFGMGRGGTNSLWSSGMTCCCVVCGANATTNLGRSSRTAGFKRVRCYGCYFGLCLYGHNT